MGLGNLVSRPVLRHPTKNLRRSPLWARVPRRAFDVRLSLGQGFEEYNELVRSGAAGFAGSQQECGPGAKVGTDKTSQFDKLSEVIAAVNQMDHVPQQNSPRAGEAASATRSPAAFACKRI
jgi:hypothetical protein